MKRMGQRIWKNPLIFVLIAAMLTGWTGCGDTVHSYDGVHFDTETDDHGMEEQDSQKEGASEQADLAEVDSSGYVESDLCGRPTDGVSEADVWASHILEQMTLGEKVCQMFLVTPETLTGFQTVTAAGNITLGALEQYPVGGLIYFSTNLVDDEQTNTMLKNTTVYARENHDIPIFLAVDEEGGRVARIGSNPKFSVEKVPCMKEIGDSGDLSKAYDVGDTIGAYLSELGFNLDFAPDADVLTNPSNTVIGDRSFGTDAACVSNMMLEVADGLLDNGVIPCVKHFPGHGSTAGDTHQGLAYTDKTLEELMSCELVPFQTAVDNGLPMIMVSHISVPSVTGDDTPASLSHFLVTELLREQMGFDGIVITDGMGMGAIEDNYESGEAAVLAVQAGCDMLLITADFPEAYQAVFDAVEDGRISEQQIDASVKRILRIKYSLR